MNTKWKIILLVMLVITSICGVFITLYVFDSRENLKTFVEREIISIQAIVSTVEEENSRQYHNRIKSFITYANFPKREKVISAFARQDRGELLQLATPFFKILKAENPYFSTFSWATPDNRSFLRIHRPDKFGDEIGKMRPDVMDANIEHQQHSGYMVAKTGLQYRIVQPVFYEGKHVGVVQFGLKDSLLLDALHKNFNFPVGMAIPNTKFSFIKHSTLPSLAGSTHTIQSKQIDLFQGDNGKIDWNLKQQKVTLQGRPYIIANAFNLRGYKQELQGHIFVALDVSKYEEQLQSRIVFILFLSSGLLLLSFIILYTSYGSLIQKIITLNRSLEKNNLELESRVSERTGSLQESEERFKRLSSVTFEGILIHRKGVAIEANDSLARMFGYSIEELTGQNVVKLLFPCEYHVIIEVNIVKPIASPYEVTGRKKDGTFFPVEIESRDVTGEKENFRVTALRDITKRKQAMAERDRLLQAIDQSSETIVITDDAGTIQYTNPAFEKITGYSCEEATGQNPRILKSGKHDEAFYQEMWKTLVSGKTWFGQFINKKKDGTFYTEEVTITPVLDLSGRIVNYVAVKRDITDEIRAKDQRQELEKQLHQKHKMEAIGVMAGGMAHNFNNNLAIILGNIELAQLRQLQNTEFVPLLKNAKTAALRARDLIQNIMTYSREGTQDKRLIQLPLVINETINLLRSTIPTTVTLEQIISPDSYDATVNADSSQIQEVLFNLCNNAVHAMDEKGELKVLLDTVVLQTQDIPVQYDCLPGHYVKLSIQDDGSGMSQETIDKIFDLFFTTKEVGEGTGMGLSTVQGIIKQHNGLIKVKSTLGKGTAFELYFPVIDQNQTVEIEPEDTTLPGGTEHILFVDDDEMLANLGKELLTDVGYRVTTMTDSSEALKLFAAKVDHFDLVITDQTMPELSGKELIQALNKIRPNIPTILCTGYSNKIQEEVAAELGINAFLMKPVKLPKLLQTVRWVLDGEKGV